MTPERPSPEEGVGNLRIYTPPPPLYFTSPNVFLSDASFVLFIHHFVALVCFPRVMCFDLLAALLARAALETAKGQKELVRNLQSVRVCR